MSGKLKSILVGLVVTKSLKAGKLYGEYEQYAVPLIRAERYYKHNRENGMAPKAALKLAAFDAKLPMSIVFEYLKGKVGDFGVLGKDEVLGTTSFAPDRKAFKLHTNP